MAAAELVTVTAKQATHLRGMGPRRVRRLIPPSACVLYWMSRDMRAEDNWAMLYARALAEDRAVPLRVCYSLAGEAYCATARSHGFIVRGLQETETTLRGLGIGLVLLD